MGYKKNFNLSGKLADELKKTREEINIKNEFGTIPKSIMTFKKSKILMNLIENDNQDFETEIRQKGTRGGGYAKNLKFSTYNPDQAEFIIKYYTRENDLILDPFMGRTTRPIISLYYNRKYIGFDTCKKTCDFNLKLIEKKFGNSKNNDFTIINGDGTSMISDLKDNSIDCVFTCPPYYDKEKYSGEEGDLSYISYEEFNKKMQQCFDILYKKIKKSIYKEKKFYPVIFTVGTIRQQDSGIFDMDFIFQNMAYKSGFILHDKLFTENLTPGAGYTFRRNYLYKFVTKNYETTLVFLKY